ncbi:MAG: sulfite exporter TauE/SafE family protein [Ferruginibacter sp.]
MILKKNDMDTQTVLTVIAIGIAAGVLSGLVGVGGGIIIVPSLVYLLGFSQKTAQGTSLGLILLPVGILGVLQYYKQGHINLNVVWLLAVGFVIGGWLGGKIAVNLPQETIKKIFAVLMIVIAIKMLFIDKPAKAVSQTKSTTENTSG